VKRLAMFLAGGAIAACGRSEPAENVSVPEHPEHSRLAPTGSPTLAIDVTEGLAGPEAVLWDPEQDVYFISNINGDPANDDDNGFISKISPSGAPIDLRFIDGADPNVTLHAPRGLAIGGDTLYVADNHAVRLFDRVTGKPTGTWEVPGTTFLNDLAVEPDGSVHLTETGIVLLPSGEPVKKVPYRIFGFSAGAPQVIAEGDELEGPNGIEATPDGDVMLAFMGPDIYLLAHGTKQTIAQLPTSKLDGLVVLPDGSFLVTSWDAKGIYHVVKERPPTLVFQNLITPASIGYDASRHRVLIPLTKPSLVRIEPWP
jgi:hypothetical protein